MNIEELAFKDRRTLAQLNEIGLLDIIEFLQIDRKQWINQFSKTHNESVEIQKENQKLKERIEYLERSNNRREDTIFEQRQEISDLEDKLSKIETLIINHNCDTGDIYYKYNSKFLKSELKQRILEIVYEQGR